MWTFIKPVVALGALSLVTAACEGEVERAVTQQLEDGAECSSDMPSYNSCGEGVGDECQSDPDACGSGGMDAGVDDDEEAQCAAAQPPPPTYVAATFELLDKDVYELDATPLTGSSWAEIAGKVTTPPSPLCPGGGAAMACATFNTYAGGASMLLYMVDVSPTPGCAPRMYTVNGNPYLTALSADAYKYTRDANSGRTLEWSAPDPISADILQIAAGYTDSAQRARLTSVLGILLARVHAHEVVHTTIYKQADGKVETISNDPEGAPATVTANSLADARNQVAWAIASNRNQRVDAVRDAGNACHKQYDANEAANWNGYVGKLVACLNEPPNPESPSACDAVFVGIMPIADPTPPAFTCTWPE